MRAKKCAQSHSHSSGAVRRIHRGTRILNRHQNLESPNSRRTSRSRRAPRVLQLSRRAQGTVLSETEISEQSLGGPRAAAGRRASTASAASHRVAEKLGVRTMSEDKHSWDRIPTWDGDKRQWQRYVRDVEPYLETEKLDVDFSHGARLLSRLTGSERTYAETIELNQIRRSMGEDTDTREGMIAGVKLLLKSLEREPWEWRKQRRKDRSKSTTRSNSKDVQDNPWPNGSTILRKRCWT